MSKWEPEDEVLVLIREGMKVPASRFAQYLQSWRDKEINSVLDEALKQKDIHVEHIDSGNEYIETEFVPISVIEALKREDKS